MSDWTGIALALRGPDDDALRSRLPTYMHPLAGRSLGWHVLRALGQSRPTPTQRIIVTRQPLDRRAVSELDAETVHIGPDDDWTHVDEQIDPNADHVLIVDAAAATIGDSLSTLAQGPEGRALIDAAGATLAVYLERDETNERVASALNDSTKPVLETLAHGLDRIHTDPEEHAFIVHDREDIARASAVIRDRAVQRLMERGVTFLLPETVLVDVQVRIGPDSVIYPGAVLEGETTIGAETVIGPGCRIINSRIGSGVELKGWNYIVGTSIRNRAVLEPNVRRGYD